MQHVYLEDLLAADEQPCTAASVTHFPYLIGRHSECDFHLEPPFVSRQHCRLLLKGEQLWVEDLRSRNGTLVNGEPVITGLQLKDGDVLNVGGLPFRVHVEAAPREAGGGPQRVLVVEDDADAAATLALLLRHWGHEVHVAHNGPEAIRSAQAHPPDTVLLDIRLPGMDGYEVAERLRQEPGAEPARVVAMTGHESEAHRPQAQESAIDQLLMKPVDSKVLREVLAQVG